MQHPQAPGVQWPCLAFAVSEVSCCGLNYEFPVPMDENVVLGVGGGIGLHKLCARVGLIK